MLLFFCRFKIIWVIFRAYHCIPTTWIWRVKFLFQAHGLPAPKFVYTRVLSTQHAKVNTMISRSKSISIPASLTMDKSKSQYKLTWQCFDPRDRLHLWHLSSAKQDDSEGILTRSLSQERSCNLSCRRQEQETDNTRISLAPFQIILQNYSINAKQYIWLSSFRKKRKNYCEPS